MKEKDELVNALRSEMKSLEENNDVLTKELASMKRYVVDLPTAEQNSDNLQMVSSQFWVLNFTLVRFCDCIVVIIVILTCNRSFWFTFPQLCDLQIKKLKEDRQKAENEIVRLEKKVADAGKGLQSRDQLIETLQDTCSQLKGEIEQLTVIVSFIITFCLIS